MGDGAKKLGATVLTGGASDVLGYGVIADSSRSKSVGTPLDSGLAAAGANDIKTALATALSDQEVDDTTKNEIKGFVNQQTGGDIDAYVDVNNPNRGMRPQDIANSVRETVKTASAGKGIYGVRMKNQQERSILADMPGRRQTVMGGV